MALLFLFPVTVFVESDPLDEDGTRVREESSILETIESFVDMIDTTTMTPRSILQQCYIVTITMSLGSLILIAERIAGPGLSVL